MRNIVIFVLLLFSIMGTGCGSSVNKDVNQSGLHPADTGTALITFNDYEHNFGKVIEGEKIGCTFTYKNTGTGNLIINSAVTSCGCTVPKYSNKPIPPGKTGSLEVVFDTSGRNGIQTKTITVKSNSSTPVVLLKIVAEVVSNNN